MKRNPSSPTDPYWYRFLPSDDKEAKLLRRKEIPELQLVVYRSTSDDAIFDDWIRKLENQIDTIERTEKMTPPETPIPENKISIISICGNCNNSLLLLSGQGINAFVTTDVATMGGGRVKAGSTGDENGIYYTRNFPVPVSKKLETLKQVGGKKQPLKPIRSSKPPVRVAVLDTGMSEKDEELNRFLVAAEADPCIEGASQGWNFIADSKSYNDDHQDKHGTTVTRMLLDESLLSADGNPVQIIPIKVQDHNGQSDLYDIMCALAYAKSMGAQIINASFGYYAPWNSENEEKYCVKTFKKFIKDVLTDNGILLVAAAGNATKQKEITQLFAVNETSGEQAEQAPDDPRNLDTIHFFPASFARDKEFWNVLSVTTVTPDITAVSDTQNFSRRVVDVGVPADIDEGNGFNNPLTPGTFISGSSFATPKVTGMLARNFELISGKTNKEEIIDILMRSELCSPVPSEVLVGRAILGKQNGKVTIA